MRVSGTCAFALLLAMVQVAFAGSNPARKWQTIETTHFRVHFYQGGEAFAQRVAAIAEEAYARCAAFLGLTPVEPVEVVVADDVDSANGLATVYPYDHIVLIAYPPEPESELASHDDWLRVLFYHEYAHIIHMDQVSGIPALVNRILGKTLLPNGVVNSWVAEGIATFVESRLTRGGRIGSALYDMYLRSAALQDRLLTLDQLTVTPDTPPRGDAPYLYGSYLMDYIYREYGTGPITEFIKAYGRRVVPFALNILARRHFGKDFFELWSEFAAEQKAKAQAVAARVQAEGEISGRRLTVNGEFNGYPRYSQDGRSIFFVRSDAYTREGIFEIDATYGEAQGAPRRLLDCNGGCGHLAVQGDAIYTTHLVPWRIYQLYGDVYRIDLATLREERLTERARARDVSVSRDQTLYHVTSEYDRVSVVQRDLATGRLRTLVPSGLFASIGDPRPVPESDLVVFAASRQGRFDLWSINQRTGELMQLTDDPCLDRDPEPTPDGRLVLFSSDRNGVFNIYALDLATKMVKRVTNVTGGAFWPAASPDGRSLAFSVWSAKGYDIAVLPLEKDAWFPSGTPPVCTRQQGTVYVSSGEMKPARPYSPWPTVLPRSLVPTYRLTTLDDSRLGFSVSGTDAVGLHEFSLAADSAITRFDLASVVRYAYQGTFPALAISVGTWQREELQFGDDRLTRIAGRDWVISPSLVLPIPLRDRAFSVSLSYALRFTTGMRRILPTDPASMEPTGPGPGRDASLTLSIVHDSTRTFARSISPEEGFHAGVSMTAHHASLGGHDSAVTFGAHFHQYLRLPWAKAHVLAVLFSGALSRGEAKDSFELGGAPPQDPFWTIVNHEVLGGRWLRGFAPDTLTGDTFALLNLEYRFPLWYIHRGLDTLPLAAKRLWAVAYTDWGTAFYDRPGWDSSRMGLGAELALSASLFLSFEPVFRLGYAHGLGPGGSDVVYLLVTP